MLKEASLFVVLLLGLTGQVICKRLACDPGDVQPASRVNTTDRLAAFRTELGQVTLSSRSIDAYIVGSSDAHNSEYPTAYDNRREYISGFSGSAGTAVITATKAALWTDGRYYLEADEVLDCNWELMKDGLSGTPTIEEWLDAEVPGTGGFVGVDEKLISNVNFLDMKETLENLPKQLVLKTLPTPVDTIWTSSSTPARPAQPEKDINALDLKFAGKSWQDKVTEIRASLTSLNAAAMVVTALDEVAWLFNIRGADVAYNPFFLSFAIIEADSVSLYILDKSNRLAKSPSDDDTSDTLAKHLNVNPTTELCTGQVGECVNVLEYSNVYNDIQTLASRKTILVPYDANYALYTKALNNRVVGKSPVALAKSKKNSVERVGMQNAYDRDSAALVKFLAFMESEIKAGNSWTELSAGNELDKRRKALTYSRGLSFNTISAYGSNGAIIHYRPSNATNKAIGTDSLYLLDSGGQYLDGTTDVTRTMHYGIPTDQQKEAYTRVLISAINLATLIWPEQIYGRQIDSIARYALWEAGLIYRHGTGHGIGAYLSVHEGPGRISMVHALNPKDEYLQEYQFFSDEPGYYEDGQFGVRLETIVMVDKKTTKYTTSGEQFYQFTPYTFVPFETKLIDYSYMNSKHVDWLNNYNTKVREHILPLIAGDTVATEWLNSRTQPISSSVTCGKGAHLFASGLIVAIFVAFSSMIRC